MKAGLEIRQDLGCSRLGQQVAIGPVVTTGRTKPSNGDNPGKIQISWEWKTSEGDLRRASRWISDNTPDLFIKGKHEQEQDYGYRELPASGMTNPVLGIEKFEESKFKSLLYSLIKEEISNDRFETNIDSIAHVWTFKEQWSPEISKLHEWYITQISDLTKSHSIDNNLTEVEEKEFKSYGEFPIGNTRFIKAILRHALKPVETLYINNVVKYLGAGSYKVAFLLDNDHVLAIGNKMTNDKGWEKNDPKVYQTMMKQQHDPKGGAKATDLPIYDYEEFGNNLFYVEMGKVEMPEERWKRTGQSVGRRGKVANDHLDILYKNLLDLRYYALKIMSNIPQDLWNEQTESEVLKTVLNSDGIKRIFENGSLPSNEEDIEHGEWGLKSYDSEGRNIAPADRRAHAEEKAKKNKPITSSKEEMLAYVRAIVRIAKRRGMQAAQDAHPKNIGFLYHNPDEMVVFDIAE